MDVVRVLLRFLFDVRRGTSDFKKTTFHSSFSLYAENLYSPSIIRIRCCTIRIIDFPVISLSRLNWAALRFFDLSLRVVAILPHSYVQGNPVSPSETYKIVPILVHFPASASYHSFPSFCLCNKSPLSLPFEPFEQSTNAAIMQTRIKQGFRKLLAVISRSNTSSCRQIS